MDFFDLQDQARRRTIQLLFFYVLALATVIFLVFLAAAAVVEGFRLFLPKPEEPRIPAWRDLQLFGWMAVYVLLIVGGGTLYRWLDLRRGGGALARMFGARRIDTATPGSRERQIVNVVEEMSIAAGIPVPEIYVLGRQSSINAMAAGYSVDDAAILLTRGAVEHLGRDEIQGVVAHEFSHILNGDMRLNQRLISLLNGLVAMHLAGATLLYLVYDREDAVGINLARAFSSAFFGVAILFLGFSLKAIGYVGAIAARLIQAAVSRQREILADAAAVQFTRNPAGLGGALIKIGGHVRHGTIRDAHAEETSHMFIVEAVNYTHSLFDSHPPLLRRILLIDPSFDGVFPHLTDSPRRAAAAPPAASPERDEKPAPPRDRRIAQLAGAAPAAMVLLEAEQLDWARRVLSGIPAELREAVHEIAPAQAILLFLLCLERPEVFKDLEQDPAVIVAFDRLFPALRALSPEAHLPLAEMLLPTLHLLSPEQYASLRERLETGIAAEDLSLAGFCLRQVALHHLDRHFGGRPGRSTVRSLKEVEEGLFVVLGALAYAGPKDADEAISAAKTVLPLDLQQNRLPRPELCGSQRLAEALAMLPALSTRLKRTVMEAAVLCVSSDGKLAAPEADLLHVLAAALGLPAPEILGLDLAPAPARGETVASGEQREE